MTTLGVEDDDVDLGLLVRLGLATQPWTLPVLGVGTLMLALVVVRGWRQGRPWRVGEVLWAGAVLAYVAVTMTPTTDGQPGDWSRLPIPWHGWVWPFAGLFSPNPEALANSWMLLPAGLLCAAVRTRRRASAVVLVLLLPVVAELGLQPFRFMGRSVTTADLVDNLSGAVLGLAGAVLVRLVASGPTPPRPHGPLPTGRRPPRRRARRSR